MRSAPASIPRPPGRQRHHRPGQNPSHLRAKPIRGTQRGDEGLEDVRELILRLLLQCSFDPLCKIRCGGCCFQFPYCLHACGVDGSQTLVGSMLHYLRCI